MHRIIIIPAIFLMLLLFSCIKAFEPAIDSNAKDKYVVSGLITDHEGWQEVEVSLSSPIQSPRYIPVPGCQVRVLDDKGHVFPAEEYLSGHYHVWMEQQHLIHGNAYKVTVKTPGGEELESEFDLMPTGPQIDSVYYFVKETPTPDPAVNNNVMQFYVDLNATGGDFSQFYKWDIVETWEYHAKYPVEYYYDGTFHEVIPPDYTNNVCWSTTLVKNVFTVSTKGLTQNEYNRFPLHAVDGTTSRLGVLYSILVSQLAISEEAYNYWERLRINSNEQGGLYERQPFAIKGNVQNLTNPDKDVLGFFYTAATSERRYFYHDVEGIDLVFKSRFCSEDPLGMKGWLEFSKEDYPVYYYFNLAGNLRILSLDCVDCRGVGGSLVKPDFWPN